MKDPFLDLFSIIEDRKKSKSKKSYTLSLFKEGEKKIAQKFGEESAELIIDYLKGTKNTDIDALDWLKKVQDLGAGEILLTSMDKDGTKSGFDLEILSRANDLLGIPVIASGGVGSIEHFYEGAKVGKADALLAASVFHFNEFSIMDVKNYLKEKNIEVRT